MPLPHSDHPPTFELDSVPDAIVIAGSDGRIALVNAQAETLFGYPRAELIGQPVTLLIPAGLGNAGAPRRASLERRGRRSDASEFPAEISLSRSDTPQGLRATAAIRDVSDRMRAEATATRLASIVESTHDAVISATIDGAIATWNHGAEQMYGYTAEEAIGSPVTLIAPSGLESEFDAVTDGWRRRKGIVDFETVRRRKDGSLVDVSLTLTPIVDPAGNVVGGSSIARDISERKRAEHALREAEELLALAFDHSPHGMTIAGPDLKLIKVNQAFADMVGQTIEELHAEQTPLRSTYAADIVADRKHIGLLLAGTADVTHWDKRYTHRDGHTIWARVSVAALRHADGTLRSLVGQIEDVSDRKELEEQLRHLADHDALTGLRNRRIFDESLAAQLGRCHRYGETAALLMIDLDGFKQINDTHGHKIGDDVLQLVAQVIERRVRSTDLAARIGGDEFAVLLPHSSVADASTVAIAIERAIANAELSVDPYLVRATASVGIAIVDAETPDSEAALLEADRAMYHAKRRQKSA